jgi:hypothetical protein
LVSSIIIICILVSQLFSNAVEWRRAPSVRHYFANMITYALYPYDMPVDQNGMTPLINTLDDTLRGLEIMRKYKLNVFHDYYNFSSSDGRFIGNGKLMAGVLGPGWYDNEGGYRWMDKKAGIIVKTGDEGKLIIEGNVPDFLSPNEIKIYANNNLVYDNNETGSFIIESSVEKDSILNIQIEASKSVIPKEKGMNNDIRELALTINNIILQ